MAKGNFFPLPLFKSLSGGRFKFPAVFNGSHIIIDDPIAILNLHSNGFFGTTVPGRKKLKEPNSYDEMSEVEENKTGKELHDTEHLFLLLEEAFFLLLLNCIQITDYFDENKSIFDVNHAWRIFNQTNYLFTQNYLVYHYFRSKNWIVKAGLKFGGDFLLYKASPEVCHSSYVVIIDVSEGDIHYSGRFKPRRSQDVSKLLGINRLAEAAGKEVLMARISWPQNKRLGANDFDDAGCIKHFEIQELVLSRLHNKLELK